MAEAVDARERRNVETPALKTHAGNAVDPPDRLLWLIKRVAQPALRVVYDYSHFELIGLGLEESLRALAPYTSMIQLKDSRQMANGAHHFLLPGEGGTDYISYFRTLDRMGFAGPVVVEISAQLFNQPGHDPVDAALRSFKVLADAPTRRRRQ